VSIPSFITYIYDDLFRSIFQFLLNKAFSIYKTIIINRHMVYFRTYESIYSSLYICTYKCICSYMCKHIPLCYTLQCCTSCRFVPINIIAIIKSVHHAILAHHVTVEKIVSSNIKLIKTKSRIQYYRTGTSNCDKR